MYPLAIIALGLFLVVGYTSRGDAVQAERLTILSGDVAATNFLSYRQAVVAFYLSHPGTTGAIPDSALTWQSGFARDVRWTNVVDNHRLYVFSVGPANGTLLDAVFARTGGNLLVGIKTESGELASVKGKIIPLNLPAEIPQGSLVYIGS